MKIEESLTVTFDETPPPSKTSPLVDDNLDEEEAIKVTEKKNLENDIEDKTLEVEKIVNIKESKNHPLENVIGNLNQKTLRSQVQNQSNFFCFISTIDPKNVIDALKDENWIIAMQEELNQFITNYVWELVPDENVNGETIMKLETKMIAKDGTVYKFLGKFPGYTPSKEEGEEPEKKGLKEAPEKGPNYEFLSYRVLDSDSDLES
ncbi:hypothetical protein Tco_0379176 [Tanacetum coccineum]